MEGSSHNLKGIQWEYKGKGRKNGEWSFEKKEKVNEWDK